VDASCAEAAAEGVERQLAVGLDLTSWMKSSAAPFSQRIA
jgi:hypothetical protein